MCVRANKKNIALVVDFNTRHTKCCAFGGGGRGGVGWVELLALKVGSFKKKIWVFVVLNTVEVV